MRLTKIRDVIDAAGKIGKLTVRKNEHFQLIDKDGKAAPVSVIGVYKDELVITALGHKKDSYLVSATRRFEILRSALAAAGIFSFLSRK